MPRITQWVAYDGAEGKAQRLGLSGLLDEVKEIVSGFQLRIEERKDANGSAVLRKMIDEGFESRTGWTKRASGGIDWTRCHQVNGTSVCVGVEVQVSGRSDLVAVDLIHLKESVTRGVIDIGILAVPDDSLGYFMTDRTPKFSEVNRHLTMVKAEDIPLFILAFAHDGTGPALRKQTTRRLL